MEASNRQPKARSPKQEHEQATIEQTVQFPDSSSLAQLDSAVGQAEQFRRLTWIVERSFAWLGRNRRLSKDFEYSLETSETHIGIAATRLMLNRIAAE